MISIYMGQVCLLRGEWSGSMILDFDTGHPIHPTNSLASLFTDRELDIITQARCLPLHIHDEAGRKLTIRLENDGIEEGVVVEMEDGSLFDIHDVTLVQIFDIPVHADAY